jgi:RNA-binding protein YhbY
VRLLSSFEADRHESAEKLARVSSSVLVEVRGKTVVLARD